jgi:N-terminal 7TM region of histidine kinase
MIFIVLFLFSLLSSIATIIYLWPVRKRRCGFELLMFLFSASVWVGAAFIELFMKGSSWANVITTLIYAGASTSPIFILLFGLRYSGILSDYSKKIWILAMLFPVLSTLIAATNELHHLMWKDAYNHADYLRVYIHGPIFYVFAFISYLFTYTSGAVFFFHTFKSQSNRKEGSVLLLGFMLPWIAGMFYVTGKNPFPGLDIIALTMGYSTLFISYSFRATGLFKDKTTSTECDPAPLFAENRESLQTVQSLPEKSLQSGQVRSPVEQNIPLDYKKVKLNHHDLKNRICNCMVLSIKVWENATGKSKVEFAEESGLWNVQTDPNGWRRTQTLDRYLSLSKFPQNPRIQNVVKSVEFILSQVQKLRYHDDSVNELHTLLNEIRYY